jgi:hypothetical protein
MNTTVTDRNAPPQPPPAGAYAATGQATTRQAAATTPQPDLADRHVVADSVPTSAGTYTQVDLHKATTTGGAALQPTTGTALQPTPGTALQPTSTGPAPLTNATVAAELAALGPAKGALDVSTLPCKLEMLVKGNPVRIHAALQDLGWNVQLADRSRQTTDQPVLELKSPSLTLQDDGIDKLVAAISSLRDAQAEPAGPMSIVIPQKIDGKDVMSPFGEINFIHMHRANDDVLYRLAANGQSSANVGDKETYALPLSQDFFRGNFYRTVEQTREVPVDRWVGDKFYGSYERTMVSKVIRDRVRLDDNDWRGKLTDARNAVNSSIPDHWQLRYFDSTVDPHAAAADVALVLGMVKAAQEGRGTWKGSATDGGPLSDVYDRPVDTERFDDLMRVLVGDGNIKTQLQSQFQQAGGKLGSNADIHLWNTLHTDVLGDSAGRNVAPSSLPSLLTLEPPATPPAVRWVNGLSVDQRRADTTQPIRSELLQPRTADLLVAESSSGPGWERYVGVDRNNGSVHAGYNTNSGLTYEEVQAPRDEHSYFRADVDFVMVDVAGFPTKLTVEGVYGQDGVHVEAHRPDDTARLPAAVTPEGRILVGLGGLNAFIDPARMEYGLSTGAISDGEKTRELQKEVWRPDLSSYLIVNEERSGNTQTQQSRYLKLDYTNDGPRAEAVQVSMQDDSRQFDRKKLTGPGQYFVETGAVEAPHIGWGRRFINWLTGSQPQLPSEHASVTRLSEDAVALAMQVSLAPARITEALPAGQNAGQHAGETPA